MTRNIYRGTTLIGTITLPSESGAPVYGMEVLATTAFPASDPDGDNQFESYERAERFLNVVYEAHCEAQGVTPEPMTVLEDGTINPENQDDPVFIYLFGDDDHEVCVHAPKYSDGVELATKYASGRWPGQEMTHGYISRRDWREAAQERAEIAAHDAAVREERLERQRVLAEQDVLSADERAELLILTDSLIVSKPAPVVESPAPAPAPVVDADAEDDLPF